jgi:protein-disulfide isomerase
MRKVAFVLLAAALLAGGSCQKKVPPEKAAPPAPPAQASAKSKRPAVIERRPATAEGIARGSADAVIDIVEFADFECQYCAQSLPTLERVLKEYQGKVRLLYRNFPLLGVNEDAVPAAEAAMAAEAQGKFWPMHDKLFANRTAHKRADLERYARELGLDLPKFKAALDNHQYLSRIQADLAAGQALGVPFTPVFFLNGRPLGGAQGFDEWKRIIDDELAIVGGLLASGVPAGELRQRLMKDAAMPATKPGAGPLETASSAVYQVALGDAPARGARQPKVTIVEFCEFQCPYCKSTQPTLKKVLETYGDDVQLAWKHMPLPMHRHSALAALASEAAHAQGKFWEMHDLMFANQESLDRPSLERYARQLGLDLARFNTALDTVKLGGVVDRDAQQAQKLGRTGTPSFFVNGRSLTGVHSFEVWKGAIDEEIVKANAKLAAGVPRQRLYQELTKGGLEQEKAVPAAHELMPKGPAPDVAVRVDLGDAPVRGPRNALVTVVVFSDFECPFCARVEPTLARIMEAYKGKVRLVWKDYPLPFHQKAMPAALAARAAGAQGKFWEMHDRLFARGGALDRAALEKHAQELGLDLPAFRAALDSEKDRAAVQADQRQGSTAGVTGTPAFFVNGVMLAGALPFESFKATIDQQLGKARKLVAAGTPATQVYDALMKRAHAGAVEAASDPKALSAAPGRQGRRP